MHGTYLAFKRMSRANGGKGGIIINTASVAGLVGSNNKESVSYFTAKHAVVGLTKSLGTPSLYATDGIRLACICPTFVDTDILQGFPKEEMKDKYKDLPIMPVSRISTAFVSLMNADVSISNGKALAIFPGCSDFFWPNHDEAVVTFLGIGSKLFKLLRPEGEIFNSRHQFMWLVFILFVLYILLNLLRCWLF